MPAILAVGLAVFLLASWRAPPSPVVGLEPTTASSSSAGKASSSRAPPLSHVPLTNGTGLTRDLTLDLRERTYDLFRHGWEAYMESAYPAVRPSAFPGAVDTLIKQEADQ